MIFDEAFEAFIVAPQLRMTGHSAGSASPTRQRKDDGADTALQPLACCASRIQRNGENRRFTTGGDFRQLDSRTGANKQEAADRHGRQLIPCRGATSDASAGVADRLRPPEA